MFPGCYGDGKPKLESCIHCCEPTGRAGKGEDSIYAGDVGPFCESCWDEIKAWVETDRDVEIDRLNQELEQSRNLFKTANEGFILRTQERDKMKQRLAAAEALLREACDHMPDTADGWAENWIKKAEASLEWKP